MLTYINLRDTAEKPRWVLPTLTFHEGIPGHHLQLSLAQEADLPPLIRKGGDFGRLHRGLGSIRRTAGGGDGRMYEHDPLGHVEPDPRLNVPRGATCLSGYRPELQGLEPRASDRICHRRSGRYGSHTHH